jgi:hypothetical protein
MRALQPRLDAALDGRDPLFESNSLVGMRSGRPESHGPGKVAGASFPADRCLGRQVAPARQDERLAASDVVGVDVDHGLLECRHPTLRVGWPTLR